MNNRQIVASLNQIANELDSNGLYQEANVVTNVMVKISQYSGLDPNSAAGRAVGLSGSSLYALTDQQIADSAIANARSKMADGDVTGALKELEDAGKKINDEDVALKLVKEYNNIKPAVTIPNGSNLPQNTPNITPIGKPKPPMSNKPSQPSSKPGMPSKPGSSESSTPKSADGLDRWVNKAENIYNAWGSKGGDPNSSAFGLVKDIVDYMKKVKSNLPTTLHGSADTKIKRVQLMLQNIFDGLYNPALAPVTLPYGVVGGYPKKGVNPFTTGPKMTEKQLNYQARQEGKSY